MTKVCGGGDARGVVRHGGQRGAEPHASINRAEVAVAAVMISKPVTVIVVIASPMRSPVAKSVMPNLT